MKIAVPLKSCQDTFLLLLGSLSEYVRPTLKNNPVNEDSTREPVSEYGITKFLATEYLKYLGINRILRSGGVRIFNVYGQYESRERLIPEKVLKILNCLRVALKNSKVSWDFIHITDVV